MAAAHTIETVAPCVSVATTAAHDDRSCSSRVGVASGTAVEEETAQLCDELACVVQSSTPQPATATRASSLSFNPILPSGKKLTLPLRKVYTSGKPTGLPLNSIGTQVPLEACMLDCIHPAHGVALAGRCRRGRRFVATARSQGDSSGRSQRSAGLSALGPHEDERRNPLHRGRAAEIIWSAATARSSTTTTNNTAEYVGLKEAAVQRWAPLEVVGDSSLILGQMQDYRAPKAAHLLTMYAAARRLADTLGVTRWNHHLRAFNRMTDTAANIAMDARASSRVHHPTQRPEHAQLAGLLSSDFAHWQETRFA